MVCFPAKKRGVGERVSEDKAIQLKLRRRHDVVEPMLT